MLMPSVCSPPLFTPNREITRPRTGQANLPAARDGIGDTDGRRLGSTILEAPVAGLPGDWAGRGNRGAGLPGRVLEFNGRGSGCVGGRAPRRRVERVPCMDQEPGLRKLPPIGKSGNANDTGGFRSLRLITCGMGSAYTGRAGRGHHDSSGRYAFAWCAL